MISKTTHQLLKILLVGTSLALISSCLENNSLAGGSSEIGNAGVAGIVSMEGGVESGKTVVKLYPANYNPALSEPSGGILTSEIAEDGTYSFPNVEPGSYHLIARNQTRGFSALRKIELERGLENPEEDLVLQASSRITISLSNIQGNINGSIFIPGTNLFAKIRQENIESNTLSIEDLPSGSYDHMMYLPPDESEPTEALEKGFTTVAGENKVIGPYFHWNNRYEIKINTSPTGADIRESLDHFPLLIRLDGSNFDFNSAANDGSDIRFTSGNKLSILAYEIERWDTGAERAEIWVRVASLAADSPNQRLYMYTGRDNVQAGTNGPATFSETDGFTGVWHLADNNSTSKVSNSTNSNHGTFYSKDMEINTATQSNEGQAGLGMEFNGYGPKHWVSLGADKDYVSGAEAVTLSLWVKSDSDAFDSKELLSFSIENVTKDTVPQSRAALGIAKDKYLVWTRAPDSGSPTSLMSNEPFQKGIWYHLVASLDIKYNHLSLYLNGRLVGTKSGKYTATKLPNTPSGFSSLGANDNGSDDWVYGILDEARVAKRLRSADWVKMSFENQKRGSGVVTISLDN